MFLPMTPHFRFLAAAVAALLALVRPSLAQEYQGKQLVAPSLVADSAAVAAGKPFTVGVLLKIAPGWHTYWKFSGDSGAPLTVEWELPEGFTAGPLQWPTPHARMDEGDMLTYVFEDEVLLPVEVIPPAQLATGNVILKAKLKWLVCEKTCVPGSGDAELALAVGEPSPANLELFTKWRAQLPKAGDPPFAVTWNRTATAMTLQVTGVPEETKVEFFPLPPTSDVTPGHPTVGPIAEDGARTITLPIEGGTPDLAWQAVLAITNSGGARESWTVTAPPGKATAAVQAAPPMATVTSAAPSTTLPNPGPTSPLPPAIASDPAAPGLGAMLGFAFLGGLILNLMPCVLPVIALKIFGFVQQAGEEPRRVFRLGLAFVAGVFAFFLGLAALISALHLMGRGLSWGFQFQNAYILTGLIALVFIFALSMFGVFEVTLGGDAATKLDSLSRRDGYGGAFAHGMFTTLLGTSCTAPFLAPVLGFASIQPPHIVFLLFVVIAAGMSLPYFLLTWQPAWMRFLPKPGAWMERLKQFMGFILLGVVVWLLDSVSTRGAHAVVAVSAFLLLLGVGCWSFGAFRNRAAGWIFGAGLAIGGWFTFIEGKLEARVVSATGTETTIVAAEAATEKGGIPWQPFSPARLEQALASGTPVFIDFTADWCLNCKYNEKFVLETAPVRAAFREKNVLAIKADWTNGDEEITRMLKQFGRVGVPAYVLYPGGKQEPAVLPELLTKGVLLEHLGKLP